MSELRRVGGDPVPVVDPWWRDKGLVRAPVSGLVVTVAAFFLGMYPLDALIVGLLVTVGVMAGTTIGAGGEYVWPEARFETTDGTRSEMAAITWSLIGRDGRVSEAAVRRLRVVTRHRLARHGLRLDESLTGDPDDVAHARRLLGDRVWTILTARGGWMPAQSDIEACVHALENINPQERSHT